jgi:Cu/Ag efflux pump CusA
MAEAEQPDRLRADREVTVDDVRQLVASATPHFAYQIRNRIRKLIRGLPADSPVRLYGEAEIARLEQLGFTGEVRGTPEQPGMEPLPSVSEHEQPRYVPGATRG